MPINICRHIGLYNPNDRKEYISSPRTHQSTLDEVCKFSGECAAPFNFFGWRKVEEETKAFLAGGRKEFLPQTGGGRWEPNSSPNRLPERKALSRGKCKFANRVDHLDSPLSDGEKPLGSQTLHYIVQAGKPSQTRLSVIPYLKSRFKYSKDSRWHYVSVRWQSSSMNRISFSFYHSYSCDSGNLLVSNLFHDISH